MNLNRDLKTHTSLKAACILLMACSSNVASGGFCQKLEGQASKDDPETLLIVGNCYRTDNKGEVDYAKAEQWYKAAVDSGYPKAMASLAGLYLFVMEDKAKFDTAINLLKEAAENDVANAYFMLGIVYLNGLGVDRDRSLSIEYFRKAAERGHGWAMLTLYEEFAVGEEKEEWKKKYIEVHKYMHSWEGGYSNFLQDSHAKEYILHKSPGG